jgi:hypothetical protein
MLSSPDDGAIDVLGCDIDIDMMALVQISLPSIEETFKICSYHIPMCSYIALNIDTLANV